MGKTRIVIIIILLLIVTAFLIVTALSGEGSEQVISSKKIESEQPNSGLEQAKFASHDEITDEESVDVNQSHTKERSGAADASVYALNEESRSSGLDIMTAQEQLAGQFDNEEQDYHWSGYWESELQTMVLFVGARALVESSEVECKSSTCAVTVRLSVDGPQNTVMALEALSEEFAQRRLKFVPESIDPATGEIVFYTQPGGIPE